MNVCNGAFQITYPVGANFPQPAPPGNTGDDTLAVKLDLGAGAITGGTNNRLTVTDVRFDLDCSDSFPSPGCTDQGDVMEYLGDGTITTTCAGVNWNSTAITTNQLRFTPSPSIIIPAGAPIQCSLSFNVKVAHLPSAPVNTSGTTKEVASYGANTTCDNNLTAGNFVTGQIFFCPVCSDDNNACTTDSCDSNEGACVYAPISCDDSKACTIDTCDTQLGCQHMSTSCESKCTAKELAAVGKKAFAKAKCHSKSVAKGQPTDSTCLTTAEMKFSDAYAKAMTAGDCRTTTDAGTVEGKIDTFIDQLDATLVNGSAMASKCTSKEWIAAGKKVLAKLKCHEKGVAKGQPTDSACLMAVETKFTTAYGKAVKAGGCINGTDSGTVEGKVDTFVDDLEAILAP